MLVLGTAGACEAALDCDEPNGAQVLDEFVEVSIGTETVRAELADDSVERERGWRKRSCDRQALLLVSDAPGPLPVWGCDLVDAIEAIGLRAGEVVYATEVPACPLPCRGCPIIGEDIVVDAVLETPVGLIDVEPGDPTTWP